MNLVNGDFFVTVVGFMGYMKSGSQKSLLSGGISASLLFFVYTQLPTRPVLASSIGLGKSLIKFLLSTAFPFLS